MDTRVAGSGGTQVTAHKVNRRDRECQIRRGHDLAARETTPSGATPVGSSYRQMGPKDPILALHAFADECPVQVFAEAGKPPAPHSHPVDSGRAARRKGARTRQSDRERRCPLERIRRGGEPGQTPCGNVAHETQRDVQLLRPDPAHRRHCLAHGGQIVPQHLPHLPRRPDREEQAKGFQATGTATGRRTASTPRTAASTSPGDEAQPSEKRTAPASEVPRILWTSGAQ